VSPAVSNLYQVHLGAVHTSVVPGDTVRTSDANQYISILVYSGLDIPTSRFGKISKNNVSNTDNSLSGQF
jgi:hypothetical protein